MKSCYWHINFIVIITLFVGILDSKVRADIYLDDGNVHNISTELLDRVWVYNSFPDNNPTTVNVFTGGRIETCYAEGESRINLQGGTMNFLRSSDESIVIMSYGTIDETIAAEGNSNVAVYDGLLGQNFMANDEATIYLYGGSVSGNYNLNNWSHGFLFGGSIGEEIVVNQDCELTIGGAYFMIDGNPVNYGTYTTGGRPYVEMTISGTLIDGTPLNNSLHLTQNGIVTLISTPEPCTLALAAIGGLALCKRRF